MFQLFSRSNAIARNSKFYFTGIPCKNGESWVRRVSSRGCMCHLCGENRNTKTEEWRLRNPDKKRETRREWCSNNKDKISAINSRCRNKDIGRSREMARSRYDLDRPKGALAAKKYRENNQDKISIARAKFRADNRDALKARRAEWYALNRGEVLKRRNLNSEASRAYGAAWRAANRGKYNASRAARRAAKQERTPVWLTPEELKSIDNIYAESSRLSIITGIIFHVDHIIPLRGKMVSGLHIPSNMQILIGSQNISKGNKYVGEWVFNR